MIARVSIVAKESTVLLRGEANSLRTSYCRLFILLKIVVNKPKDER